MPRRDLERYKWIESADVWKGDQLAAVLERGQAGVSFRYTSAYLDAPGPPVATTLPLTDEPVLTTSGAVPAFFAGLLPEGRRLSGLRRAAKTSLDDEMTLLLAVGADPVGDVRVLPSGQPPTATEPLVAVHRTWDEISFSEVLADAGVHDPVALAGVQDKASARMMSVPVSRSGKRYLLKVDPPEYPNVVVNEDYFLRLSRRAKFPTASAKVIHDRDGRAGLLVERFDRVLDSDTRQVRRLPVEDAGQLLGLYPADKYRTTSEHLTRVVGDVCAARSLAMREVFRQIAFAWLTGNGDLHAKNFSVLGTDDGEWRLAPAYEIPSTAPYGDRTLALSVGGRRDGLSRRALLTFAQGIGLSQVAAEQTLDKVLEATAPALEELSGGDFAAFPPQQTQQLIRLLRHRRKAALS